MGASVCLLQFIVAADGENLLLIITLLFLYSELRSLWHDVIDVLLYSAYFLSVGIHSIHVCVHVPSSVLSHFDCSLNNAVESVCKCCSHTPTVIFLPLLSSSPSPLPLASSLSHFLPPPLLSFSTSLPLN